MARTARNTALALIMALVAVACSDDPVRPDPPTMTKVAGTYVASEKTGKLTLISEDDEEIDLLAEGAEIKIELDKDGTASGRIFVPAVGDDEEELEVDLDGSWTLKGDTVRLSHDTETFLHELSLRVKNGKLEGSGKFLGAAIEILLIKD